MWETSSLQNFINTMIKVNATIGGISWALLLFTLRDYKEKWEDLIDRSALKQDSIFTAKILNIKKLRGILRHNLVSVMVLLGGLLVFIPIYYGGLLTPLLLGYILIFIYATGVSLMIFTFWKLMRWIHLV